MVLSGVGVEVPLSYHWVILSCIGNTLHTMERYPYGNPPYVFGYRVYRHIGVVSRHQHPYSGYRRLTV